MLDPTSAARVILSPSQNLILLSMGTNPLSYKLKSSWNVMIQGVWALLYPYIHQEFPSREEITAMNIGNAVKVSQGLSALALSVKGSLATMATAGNASYQLRGPIVVPVPPVASPVLSIPASFIPKEVILMKRERPIQIPDLNPLTVALEAVADVETGPPILEPIRAFALSPSTPLLVA